MELQLSSVLKYLEENMLFAHVIHFKMDNKYSNTAALLKLSSLLSHKDPNIILQFCLTQDKALQTPGGMSNTDKI